MKASVCNQEGLKNYSQPEKRKKTHIKAETMYGHVNKMFVSFLNSIQTVRQKFTQGQKTTVNQTLRASNNSQ